MDVEGSAFENDMAADAGPAGAGSPSHITCSSSALSPSKSNPPMTHNDGPCNGSNKRKRRPAGTPDPDAEVVALSPRTLLESDRYICDICSQGFQRDQNLQMHRRRHKVPWKLLKRQTTDTRKRVYVCPEPTCLHHDPSHALGDLVGIKKHYRRKHSTDKQWKCEKCSKGYAVQSDYKAHLKTCGTRGHCCDCGRVFSRVESFIEHQDTCTAAKEKSALQIGGLVGGSQANRGLADSPSSRSLSTECLSVDPSRSALSDSAVMPSCSEYGDMPVNSSSPSGNQQHWMMLGDSRELQLLPEESGGSRGSTSMMVMSSTSGGRRVIPVIELKCNTPPTAQSAGGSGGGGGGGGGGGAETTPGLQLSIGPYSNTEDASNLRDKASISMIGPSLPDVYEVKPVTATERAAFSSMQQHRLQRRASEGSNSEVNTAVAGLGALQSLTSASLRGGGGGGGSGSALGGGGLGSSVGHNGCGGIGDGLTLSSSSPPTTATSCARGGGGECSDVAQMHHLLKGPAGARKNVSSNLLLAGVKESSLLSRRRSRSPNQYQQYDMHNGQSDLVVVPASTECMGGAWGQANRQQNAPLTPTTPSTTNGGTYVTDLESETAIMPMRNRQYGGGGGGGAAAREHMEAAVRAMEEASRHKDMASNAREMARPDVGSAWWTDLAAARRTKEQARVEREEAESQLAQAELLKQEAREQMKLASAEKTYAEHARENAKRQRELAESELNSAKRVREQAQSDFAKAQMLKEQADRFMDAASGRLSVAAVMSNQPSTDASSSAQSEQQQQNNNNNNSGSSSSSKNNQRQVPPCLDFTSLPLPNFSSTSSPFQISTPPRYPSSMIPVTFIGTSAICPPPMSLPPSFDTVCTTAASHSTYSSSMVTEGHLRTPKPEMI
ncbi:zinc finger protein IDD14/15/16 [Marchantia polymorpha subsp. ruderalis]|uniref:C2H2-type domain-containing protein n=4 Tax=Marchantia polymorpha TaxID=3197 RepID=A0AAF6AQJ3_MARPO|nr:hypothetical protein MARPO_0033s0095 [Marchantia polymorpha]BBM98713.1 hypothetical protein Mp_1g15660 [Marchantia polymorpha subsp. ruderalis]|eukprot:PTQ41693.1 hypothetical protein MARPO_0033s0095 [Marchantia polymorpha]